ncbi:sigma factor-like helix-turn-helix DNA-binding protein [Ruegeria sp. THAF33]|uniref:sigma factor-like helix-turn-helix DNA-binding protein n=1 Tax=Ruegeria sp. THAF33 TaxID=2587853 RepID=UPI0012694562|nr:sigma factor-like helix-turn-helix DNA-binding protein [Ruegeria sp. THAF33]QFT75877.1 RNA polymerase sigma factor SigA [Ruegeria sp. THAF33]
MLSRLGKKLKALVSRETVKTVSTAPSVATDGQDHSATSVIKDTSTSSTVEPAPSLTATEPTQTAQPAPVLELEKPPRTLDRIEGNEPEVALNATEADQTDTAWAKVVDKAPDDQLEARPNSDDDLTVLQLALAIEEPSQGSPSKRQATYTSSSRPRKPVRPASQNALEEEHLLDLAIQNFASTRLINMLRSPENELPVTTLNDYMLAPDSARESFEQLKNFGAKLANELDRLVRKSAAEKQANEINRKKWEDAPTSIVEIIREADCSVRLLNAITANSDRLPINTVREYMEAPEIARNAFLKLPNLGKKSASELDEIVRSVAAFSTKETGRATGAFDEETTYKRANQVAELFLSGMQYPDELFEWSPPTRLTNLLKIDQKEHRSSFGDFLKTYDETSLRIRSLPGCGRKSIEQLNQIVSRVIEARLSICGADTKIAPQLRSLLHGDILSDSSLAKIIELGNIKPEDIKASESSSIEELTVAEVIAGSVSSLNERQQDILHRRYGINSGETETLEQVASSYDVTRERIRQIEKKAKQKLQTKRTIKILIGALEQEGSLEKLFKNRKIVSEEQISAVSKLLAPEERLAVDLAYGDLRSYLDAESIRTDAGWVQEHDLLTMSHEPEDLSGSFRQRIVSAIGEQKLPIRLSEIAASLPDYPLSEIKGELSARFEASLEGDLVRAAPRLPSSVRCILILREAGHAMHCDEIRARMHEVFAKDESIHHIGSTLAGLEEALIVERGTYDLYENLSLTDNDLEEIRDRTLRHLESVGGFISAKVLFSDLFQGETERFGISFGPYMLLGIVQDDERFVTKRGLMIGLATDENKSEFRGLGEEVLAVLTEAQRSMTLVEIAEELEGRRDVFTTSISIGLENSPDAVSVGRGRFDLVVRAIGQEERQTDLILACAIALADGPRTAFALSEFLSPLWGEIQTRPLLSFLKNRDIFDVNQKIVTTTELPEVVSKYIEIRDQTLEHGCAGVPDLEAVQDALKSQDASDLTRLDHLFTIKEDEPGEGEEMLGMILGDFGID